MSVYMLNLILYPNMNQFEAWVNCSINQQKKCSLWGVRSESHNLSDFVSLPPPSCQCLHSADGEEEGTRFRVASVFGLAIRATDLLIGLE